MSRFLSAARVLPLCFTVILGASDLALPSRAQSTKSPQQPLYLPDPTPRQRDPHTEFGDDPASRARQQQAAALQKEQLRVQVVADTNEILLLAEQLRDHAAGHETAAPAQPNTMMAQRIEKLAKGVKEKMKLQ